MPTSVRASANPFVPGPQGRKRQVGFIIGGVIWIILMTFLMSFFTQDAKVLTAKTEATVTSTQIVNHKSVSRHSRGHDTCRLTAQYTVGGKQYTEAAFANSEDNCKPAVNSQVSINYNPSNPEQFLLTSAKNGYAVFSVINYTIGAALILLGIAGALWQKESVRNRIRGRS